MKLQLIRNATMKISYAGRTMLTDPMLSAKGAFDPFAGIARNPTVELPFSPQEIVKDIDCVLLSHRHPDHFDNAASLELSKNTLLFCQPGDEEGLKAEGFLNVLSIDSSHDWEGIAINRTDGQHGKGDILDFMGHVSGFVFQARGEPIVYWVGDSIWCDEVEETIGSFSPDIIITHSGGATLSGHAPIIMDGEATLKVLNALPNAVVIAIHMESLDHCPVTRDQLRRYANEADVSDDRLLIPQNGEIICF